MRVRFNDTLNIVGVRGHTNKFEDDSYLGLLVRIKVEHSTEFVEPTTERIVVNFRQNDIVNATWNNLRIFCDLEFGRPEVTTGTSARFGIFIPFYHPDLPNAIAKRHGDNMDFYIDALAVTPSTSGYCDVYSVMDEVPEFYVPSLISYTETAVTGLLKVPIEIDNVAQCLVFAYATTAPTLLQFFVDSELMYSGDWGILTMMSNIIARIEAASLGVVVFDLVVRGQINEVLNNRSILQSTGGAGDFNYMTQTLDFNPSISIATINNVIEYINWSLQKKINQGKVRGVTTAELYESSAMIAPKTKLALKRRAETAELRPTIKEAQGKRIVPVP